MMRSHFNFSAMSNRVVFSSERARNRRAAGTLSRMNTAGLELKFRGKSYCTCMRRVVLDLFIWLMIPLILAGCSAKTLKTVYPSLHDGRYDTEFPYASCSAELETMLKSLKRINCYTSYRTYVLGEDSRITLKQLNGISLTDVSEASILTNEAVSGTAIIVCSEPSRMAILTCAHVVDLPDTLISYLEFSDLGANKYIYSISLKEKEQIYVRDIPDGSKFSLLASDKQLDIAILGRTFEVESQPERIPVYPFPAGNSDELEWGNFIYLGGYPAGQQMITKGIVSKPVDRQGNFLTDAPFNEGFSGGIALAVRDGVPHFEWVGIGRSVSARTEYFLKPEKENFEFNYNPSVPYRGNLHVHQKRDINYGITWVIPVNEIRRFYQANRKKIMDAGFNLDAVFMERNIQGK